MKWKAQNVLEGESQEEIKKRISKNIKLFVQRKDELQPKPSFVLDMFKLGEKITSDQYKLYSYLSLQHSTNLNNTKLSSKLNMLRKDMSDAKSQTRFFSHWLEELPEKDIEKLLNSKELREYTYAIKYLRKNKDYSLSPNVENVISYKDNVISGFSKLYSVITSNYEYEWEGETLTRDELVKHVKSSKAKNREEAYKKVFVPYKKDSDVFNEIYTNIVTDWVVENTQLRGYKKPISVRNVSNDASDEAVKALMKVVRDNVDVIQRFFTVKHKLNQEEYPNNRYHVLAPYTKATEQTFKLRESLDLTLEVFYDFDKRLGDAAKQIIEEGHVDAYPRKGKRGGAFCHGIRPGQTPYIMLNHADDLNSLFTIAHEFGHGVHAQLARSQNLTNYNPGLTIAETASVFAEELLKQRLLKEADKDVKINMLVNSLNDVYSTIWRQVFFVLFEERSHELVMEGASKERLQEEYMKLMNELFGDIDVPEEFKYEWNYIPHIHHTPFYCYAYAWGNLSTLALFEKYKSEGEAFKDKYVELLSSGGKENAETLMKNIMDLDLTKERFWQNGIDAIEKELDALEALL